MRRHRKKRTVSLAHDQPRVLHVATARTWRGGEQQLAYLVKALGERDVPQVVVCTQGSTLQEYCEEQEIEHVALQRRSSFDLAFARELKRLSRDLEPDLIHTHDAHAHTLAFLAALLFRNKVPMVVSRRVDFHLKGVLSRWKFRHPSVARVICVSEAIRKIMEEDLGDNKKLSVVHSGIDPERFRGHTPSGKLRKEYDIPKDRKLIGNTAALAPHKDLFTFVDTVELLEQNNFPADYFLIGEGPSRKGIEAYIREKGLENRIHLTGFREDVVELLPELDLFLMTSETEGLGTSLLDAFVCGIPVVATDAGGIPELVKHRETGWRGRVKDPASLQEGVEQLFRDEQLREHVITRAKETSEQHSFRKVAERTLNIYRDILT